MFEAQRKHGLTAAAAAAVSMCVYPTRDTNAN